MIRLLIVDDNESIHNDFKKVLKGKSKDRLHDVEMELFGEDDPDLTDDEPRVEYEIDDAFQGEEAIEMVDRAAAENRPYALVFMDVRMPPGIDGIKAVGEIWKNHPETEVVICTAHSDYSWGQMIQEIGVSDKLQFLRKPFDMISVQQMALSCTKKWELGQNTKKYIKQLEIENHHKEEAQRKLANLNDELEHRIERRTAELRKTNDELENTVRELKSTQEQLVDSEKMAALGGLVAGVAHEINTPVGIGVTAASHLNQKTARLMQLYEAKQLKKSDLANYLQGTVEATSMILTNLHRASELIQSFKKVAVDQSSEERRPFNVIDYIGEVLLSLKPKLKKTRHKVEIQGDASLEIDSYPGAFAQIISNFLMNSILHAYEEDKEGHLHFNVGREDDGLLLRYSDDGKGIPEEDLKKIFDPFFTTRRGSGGSGLGLHIVYNIITQTLSGKISVESTVGLGTTFKLFIPFNARAGGNHGG